MNREGHDKRAKYQVNLVGAIVVPNLWVVLLMLDILHIRLFSLRV